ncbi:MAG: TRAP transporter substrate-binding protein [Lachnospiraceae bacterium]|nr:TRAP transporter substrate-binding protein [Lachnospiraceae bacterium]
MRKMKQVAALVLAVGMVLTACSGGGKQAPAKEASPAQEAASAGEKIKLKITTTQNPNQQMGVGLSMLTENLKAELGDRIEIQGYDSAQLYTGSEEITACEQGDIQMFFGVGGTMETVSKSVMAVKLPYLFPDASTAYKVLEDPEINKMLYGKLEESGLRLIGLFGAGSSAVANNKHPITKPADFVGLKMRAPGTMEAMNLAALGASSLTTPSEETYSSVQQGVIDGMITPTSVFLARNFNEVQNYLTNPGLMALTIGYLVCNEQWLTSLPQEDQDKIMAAVDKTIEQMRIDIEEETTSFFDQCREADVEVYEMNEEEIAAMKEALLPVYDQMAEEVGQEVIDALTAKVEEVTAQ